MAASFEDVADWPGIRRDTVKLFFLRKRPARARMNNGFGSRLFGRPGHHGGWREQTGREAGSGAFEKSSSIANFIFRIHILRTLPHSRSDALIVTGTGAVGLDIWKSESPAFGRSTGRHTTLGNLLLCRNVTDRQTVSSFSREHSIC